MRRSVTGIGLLSAAAPDSTKASIPPPLSAASPTLDAMVAATVGDGHRQVARVTQPPRCRPVSAHRTVSTSGKEHPPRARCGPARKLGNPVHMRRESVSAGRSAHSDSAQTGDCASWPFHLLSVLGADGIRGFRLFRLSNLWISLSISELHILDYPEPPSGVRGKEIPFM